MRVARNLAVETLRDRAKGNGKVSGASPMNPEQSLYHGEVLQRIMSALSRLARAQRECIALREFGGLSRGIAEITVTTVEQVKVQIFRARRHLRHDLEDLA